MNIVTSKSTNNETLDDHVEEIVVTNSTINQYITNIAGGVSQISGTAGAPGIPMDTDPTTGFFNDSGAVGISYAGTKRLRVDGTALTSNKKIRLDDAGTAALPSFSTTVDDTTGPYFPSAGNYAISTAGTQRLNLNSSLATLSTPLQVDQVQFSPDGSFLFPNLCPASSSGSGIYFTPGVIGFCSGGGILAYINNAGILMNVGVLQVPNGTAAAPSTVSYFDTTTGQYFPAAGHYGIAASGSQVLDLSSGLAILSTQTSITDGTDSTTTTTGALQVVGGFGCGKKATFGDIITGTKIKLVAGTAALPSISSTVDNTTGIHFPSAGTMAVDITGSEVFLFNINGISAPSGTLANAGLGFIVDPSTGFVLSGIGDFLMVCHGSQVAEVSNSDFTSNIPFVAAGGFGATTGTFSDTTDSTSPSTGALQVVGGIGCGKNAYFSRNVFVSTNSYPVTRMTRDTSMLLNGTNPTGSITFTNGLGNGFGTNLTGIYLVTLGRSDGDFTNVLQPTGLWHFFASNNGGGKGFLNNTIASSTCSLNSWSMTATTTTLNFSFTGAYASTNTNIAVTVTLIG